MHLLILKVCFVMENLDENVDEISRTVVKRRISFNIPNMLKQFVSTSNMSGKLEIQWSPIYNKFITWGAEICLYQVQPLNNENNPSVFKVSDTTCAQILTTNTNHHYVRSIDIYPKCDNDLLLAIGLVNGRVALTTFGPSEHDVYGYPGKELVPRHSRHCNAVLFNPLEHNLLAAGLDKYRSDSSILIWDINKFNSCNDVNHSGRLAVNTMAPAVELVKPVAEFGTSEVTYSLAWFHGTSKVLAAGMNGKHIKVFDLRDPNKIVNSTLTKAVFGVCSNPSEDMHIASFYENQICLWDIRNFEKPVVLIPQAKNVVKIAWCPTKYSSLASLQRDSSVINLYDIKHTMVDNEEVEPNVMERIITPGSPHNVTSFSWHSTDENRLLTIAVSGTIKDYTVFDRMTVNWSTSNIVWTHGRKTLRYVDDSFVDDISYQIKERAKARYGIQEEFSKNAEIIKDNLSLANVWNWLHLTDKLVESGIIKDSEDKYPGVLSVVSNIDLVQNKSEVVTVAWSELGYPNCQSSVVYYRHEERDKALRLCSWPLERDSQYLTDFIAHLESAKAYTRAATIAVFNLKVQLAIEILSRAPNDAEYGSSLNVVAMALSGFSDDPASMWRQNCLHCVAKLSDPYLKAMFCFLTTNDFSYDDVLNEKGLAVDDRVALACMYLPDEKLLEYVKKLSEELCNEGNLDGLLVTGNSSSGLKLLQKYLDNVGDIQSTTLIATRAFHHDLGSESIKNWIENYRNVLNSWKMFHERADFDIMLASYRDSEKPPQQVYVSCNFCGKSISAYLSSHDRNRPPQLHKTSSTKSKLSSCPNCRKPLPRCAICLQYMGTTTGESSGAKSTPFELWFTWCQTCRHGGHAGHLCEWFDEHQECPVSGCSCRCFAIDAMAAQS
ncbi:GATOR2 complex protein MIOS isoform X2 [Diabrotica undecimpunctata]|uniref:GATOR2 complex protein MIOS isoform X2 n=1 Tax=Diabrotica undecimpunctata TaxID=50387 RepID=UPI003B63E72F